jgi:hypothetical protein
MMRPIHLPSQRWANCFVDYLKYVKVQAVAGCWFEPDLDVPKSQPTWFVGCQRLAASRLEVDRKNR